jgi:hypothetical protein
MPAATRRTTFDAHAEHILATVFKVEGGRR